MNRTAEIYKKRICFIAPVVEENRFLHLAFSCDQFFFDQRNTLKCLEKIFDSKFCDQFVIKLGRRQGNSMADVTLALTHGQD
jgi:hypothetical protein